VTQSADSPEVKVRAARVEDAPALARLSGQLGYPATIEQILARMAVIQDDPSSGLFVAEMSGAVVGWMHLLNQHLIEYGSRVEVAGLVVDEAARGRGIGRCLMDRAEEWTRERGSHTIHLRSNVTRAGAHAFYEHLGFKHVKTSKTFRKMI
jgi:GNAT superfamily N-acetyltransferase